MHWYRQLLQEVDRSQASRRRPQHAVEELRPAVHDRERDDAAVAVYDQLRRRPGLDEDLLEERLEGAPRLELRPAPVVVKGVDAAAALA